MYICTFHMERSQWAELQSVQIDQLVQISDLPTEQLQVCAVWPSMNLEGTSEDTSPSNATLLKYT